MAFQSLMAKVREQFNHAQDGRIVSSKLCEQMIDVKNEATENEFWDAFIHHVEKSIIYFKSESSVEKVINFIANVATYTTRLNSKTKDTENEKSDMEGTQLKNSSEEDEEEEEPMEPFLLKCFNYFIDHHNAREKGVRLRCCQLVNKMLSLLGDEAVIDEDLSDSIYECMLMRIKDTYPPIRIQAVLALYRLQDPTDEECPVIGAYLSSISKDIHPLVRKAVLSKLAVCKRSLPYVIERTKDTKDIIRKTAYTILAEKVSMRALSIAQRIRLINDGLKEELSDEVKKACNEMLKAWFRSCGYNFVKLLEALDTESAPECSELIMSNLLEDASLEKLREYVKQVKEQSGIDVGSLDFSEQNEPMTPEKVYFWYSICKHLKSSIDGDALLQQVLPEITPYTDFTRKFAERNFVDYDTTTFSGIGQSEFILQCLLDITGLLDLSSDEIGRKNLYSLVHDLLLLPGIPISLIDVLVKRFKDVVNNEDTFVQSVVETISDIKQPLVQVVTTAMKEKTRMLQLQLARISVSMQDCKEDLECAVKQADYLQASILKDHIAELEKQQCDISVQLEECQEQFTERVECNDDPAILLKCVTIGTAMLSQVVKRGLSSTLMSLKDELFLECVKNEDPLIRNEAVKGLGLLALLKKEFASQHLVFFLQVVQVDQEFVKITAIKIIFDLFLLYGVATFDQETKADDTSGDDTTIIAETPPENQGENDENDECTSAAESVLSVLLMFLQNESSDLRSIVAEGLAKVMITGRVVSANVLTRLILLWYNPITEDDVQLRHCLGVFLPAFAFQSRKNQEIAEAAFLPALRTITNAPPTSPLNHINIGNVIDLFVQLTDVRNLEKANSKKVVQDEYDHYIHDSIAMKISNEILSDPEDPDVKLLCKALNQLSICPLNITAINDLMELSRQMDKALQHNRTAKNMVEKFSLRLQELSLRESAVDQTIEAEKTLIEFEKTIISSVKKNPKKVNVSRSALANSTINATTILSNTKDDIESLASSESENDENDNTVIESGTASVNNTSKQPFNISQYDNMDSSVSSAMKGRITKSTTTGSEEEKNNDTVTNKKGNKKTTRSSRSVSESQTTAPKVKKVR